VATDVIFVAGKDIIEEAGGHGSYIRALTLAAVGAGYTPHIFCVGREAGVFDTPYGRIHRSASPLRWIIRHGPGEGFRTRFLPFHQDTIRRRIEKFLRARSGAFIVHGAGPWGVIGVDIAEQLSTSDRAIVPVVTIWSTMRDEHEAKRRGVSRQHGVGAWLRAQMEYRWMAMTVASKDTRAITRSARVLVNYESVARQVREIPDHAPIDILPYAAERAFDDPPSPRPRPAAVASLEPADAPMVLAVSRHDSRKGLDVLIAALGLLRDRGIRFRACVVGPGPLLDVHRRLVDGHGIGDSTAIVGYATDPVAYLQHADVFVLPSIQEGSGSLSMLEAMQAGLAIVASDVDGIPEDVANGDSAVLVPPGDAGALADALQHVLTDPARRERLGRRAREVFEERFTADRFSRSLGNLYRGLLQEAEGSG
jgi:glycosyltransferase involved in cell wall biosynthesis